MPEPAATPTTCAACGAGLAYEQAFCRTTRDGVPIALCSARCAGKFLGGSLRTDGLGEASACDHLVDDWRWRHGAGS